MKHKITNKTFSAIQLTGIGVIPPRKSITVDCEISSGLRAMQKKSKIDIKEIKE